MKTKGFNTHFDLL